MRKSVLIAISGLLILALGFGGFYYLTNSSSQTQMPSAKRDPISLDPSPPMSSEDIDAIVNANMNQGKKEERK